MRGLMACYSGKVVNFIVTRALEAQSCERLLGTAGHMKKAYQVVVMPLMLFAG